MVDRRHLNSLGLVVGDALTATDKIREADAERQLAFSLAEVVRVQAGVVEHLFDAVEVLEQQVEYLQRQVAALEAERQA